MEPNAIPRAFWLTDQEVEIAEKKMGGCFIGSGYLRNEEGLPVGRLPLDLFITEDPKLPCIGVYREKNGRAYLSDASMALFYELPGIIMATIK